MGQQVGPPVPERQVPPLLAGKVLQQRRRLLLCAEGKELCFGEALLSGFAQLFPGLHLLLQRLVREALDS